MTDLGFDPKNAEKSRDDGASLRPGVADRINQAELKQPGAFGQLINMLYGQNSPTILTDCGYDAGGDAASVWAKIKSKSEEDNRAACEDLRSRITYSYPVPSKAREEIAHAIYDDLKPDDAAAIDLSGLSGPVGDEAKLEVLKKFPLEEGTLGDLIISFEKFKLGDLNRFKENIELPPNFREERLEPSIRASRAVDSFEVNPDGWHAIRDRNFPAPREDKIIYDLKRVGLPHDPKVTGMDEVAKLFIEYFRVGDNLEALLRHMKARTQSDPTEPADKDRIEASNNYKALIKYIDQIAPNDIKLRFEELRKLLGTDESFGK